MHVVLSPHSVVLNESDSLRRDHARPADQQDVTYAEKYDDRTVFYEVIRKGEELLAVGPPLLNLEASLRRSEVTLGGYAPVSIETVPLERSQFTRMQFPEGTPADSVLELAGMGVGGPLQVVPAAPAHELFRGRRVLMTLQKDEELPWIVDWATYYSVVHGVDAVLLYDNGSDKYSREELLNSLANVPGLDVIVVVDWSFKYGPQGGAWVGTAAKWDSDFCQIGAFQDARYRFLQECKGFINADVDELIVTDGSADLFDVLEESEDGALEFYGHWVVNAAQGLVEGTPPRHANFSHVLGNGQPCATKWAGIPSKWPEEAHPTAHFVRNVVRDQTSGFHLAHFRGINSAWKVKTRQEEVPDPTKLKLDEALLSCLQRAFPGQVASREQAMSISNDVANLFVSRFQSWLDWEVYVATRNEVHWAKRWTWNGNVLVFETQTSLGMLAFDVYLNPQNIRLAVSVRQADQLGKLRTVIQNIVKQVSPVAEKGLGFWLIDPIVNNPGYEEPDLGLASKEAVSSAILTVLKEVAEFAKRGQPPHRAAHARRLVQEPLRNLRHDPQFALLAERVREFSRGAQLVYVPSRGDWVQGLEHAGIKQFLEFFQIEYTQLTRVEALLQTDLVGAHGGQLQNILLMTGVGGSSGAFSDDNSGFIETIVPRFAKSIVFGAPSEAAESGGAVDHTVLYVSSVEGSLLPPNHQLHVCHDMSLFVQVPELMQAPFAGGHGYFIEAASSGGTPAQHLPPSFVLGRYGDELTEIVPLLQLLNGFDRVITDRGHVGIAAAMLDKEVELYPAALGSRTVTVTETMRQNYPEFRLMKW